MQVSRGIEEAIEVGIEEMVVDRYRYRGGVEPLLKAVFRDVKNIDMNAIQHATQPTI